MRRSIKILIPTVVVLSLGAGIGADAAVGVARSGNFSAQVNQLEARWDQIVSQGVPAADVQPLRDQLAAQRPAAQWWATAWWHGDGHDLITTLNSSTDTVFATALGASRDRARAQIDAWHSSIDADQQWLDATTAHTADTWPILVNQTTTPAAADALATQWKAEVAAAIKAISDAKTADLAQKVDAGGGAEGILATANKLIATARADNLDASDVIAMAQQVQQALDAGGAGAGDLAGKLYNAVQALRGTIALNNTIAGQVRTVLLTMDQAIAEGTPNAGTFNTRYTSAQSDFRDATTQAQLQAVQTTVNTLMSDINTELSANSCGHNVGSGKVITINLTVQEMLFYQDGCVVRATPVTTGRPNLRTPTGHFSIFYKTTPFTMVSPWPQGSQYWYPTTTVTWVMEFAGGGYFIHDAAWEWNGAYGPGSEDNLNAASHGCVHTPTDVMEWAYSWTPTGTPVIITD